MLKQLLASAASGLDHVVAHALIRPSLRASGPASCVDEGAPLLDAVAATYDRPEHYTTSTRFFGDARIATPRLEEVRTIDGGRVVDATWPSGAPFHEGVTAAYLAHAKNRTAAARLFLHDAPAATAIILVHGYLGGRYAIEEHVWGARRWFDRGADVALATLPFHGVRSDGGRPIFPSADPCVTNEGVRQAIGDVRALMGFLRTRGAARVGCMGMSLGGYVVSLLATVEPSLAFAVPVVPLADLSAFARAHVPALLSGGDTRRSRAHRVISPFARPPVVPPDAIAVVGASRDRIAPIAHARALAEHFQAPLEILPGAHLVPLGRLTALRTINQCISIPWNHS